MIRNLDYWQPASGTPTAAVPSPTTTTPTNIVIVNNNNRSAPTTTAINATEEKVNNNNEVGFGDKNGDLGARISKLEECRQSTVIVKMAHDKGERIEVTSEGMLEEDVDDLIEEEDHHLIEEEEDHYPETEEDTKVTLDTSAEVNEDADDEEEPDSKVILEDMIVEEQDEGVQVKVDQNAKRSANVTQKIKKKKVIPSKLTKTNNNNNYHNKRSSPSSSSTNSSFEEPAVAQVVLVAQQSTVSPEHHARRPMNAFLIFCKKHRPIVREKYPNLENRAITKILGDWWANLEKRDQEPFKCLASNYKDAFLSANPTFKWYKLPAPPLRTLSTRPTNSDRSYGDILTNGLSSTSTPKATIKHELQEDIDTTGEYHSPIPVNRRRGVMGKNNKIQLFKLADVNQMGGLSNLMGGGRMNDNNNNNQVLSDGENQEDMIIEEGPSCASDEGTIITPFANMRTHAARMEVTPKRKLVDVHSEFQAMKRAKKRADNLELMKGQEEKQVQSQQPLSPLKSPRACKGKKYLEFIKQTKSSATPTMMTSNVNSAMINVNMVVNKEFPSTNGGQKGEAKSLSVIKKAPQLQQQQQIIIVNPVGFPHNGYCKPQPVDGNAEEEMKEVVDGEPEDERDEVIVEEMEDISKRGVVSKGKKEEAVNAETEGKEESGEVLMESLELQTNNIVNNGKLFDASDFELDSKITALPALSLDMYLTRKRETKKKKKIGGKGKSSAHKKIANNSISSNLSGPTIQEVKEAMQKSVGSQKRKARKESITRRDVNSVTAAVAAAHEKDLAGGEDEVSGSTSDLLILATLAAGEIETHQK